MKKKSPIRYYSFVEMFDFLNNDNSISWNSIKRTGISFTSNTQLHPIHHTCWNVNFYDFFLSHQPICISICRF